MSLEPVSASTWSWASSAGASLPSAVTASPGVLSSSISQASSAWAAVKAAVSTTGSEMSPAASTR